MERQIVAFAMLAILIILMAHVVLSYSWRSQLLDRLDLFGDVIVDMREALEEIAYEALDEDRPDMIAMLGSTYAPRPAVTSRDVMHFGLAELLEGNRSYGEYVFGAAGSDPLGR